MTIKEKILLDARINLPVVMPEFWDVLERLSLEKISIVLQGLGACLWYQKLLNGGEKEEIAREMVIQAQMEEQARRLG